MVKSLKPKHKRPCWQQWMKCTGMLFAIFMVTGTVNATTYVLPKQGDDVIGQLQYARVKAGETLMQIARQYDIGVEALMVANPDVDPRALQAGERILIPSRFILPRGPREGMVINLAEKRLYHYTRPLMGPPLVSTYPISVGDAGRQTPLGIYKVIRRVRKPTWEVPVALRQQNPRLPKQMSWGPNNPLGEYAMVLNAPDCMIHGTNAPHSIGKTVTRGCVSLYPEDIAVLVHRTIKNSPVRIVNEAFKSGYRNGALYFELHKPEASGQLNLAALVNQVTAMVPQRLAGEDWQRIRMVGSEATGMAMPVAQVYPQSIPTDYWMLQLASYKEYASARKLILQLEELDLPVTTRGCDTGQCKVLAGPFKDRGYMQEISKRIKWITRIKTITLPYESEPDQMQALDDTQTLAQLD